MSPSQQNLPQRFQVHDLRQRFFLHHGRGKRRLFALQGPNFLFHGVTRQQAVGDDRLRLTFLLCKPATEFLLDHRRPFFTKTVLGFMRINFRLILVGVYFLLTLIIRDAMAKDWLIQLPIYRPIHQAIMFVGRISYSVYLVRMPVTIFVLKYLARHPPSLFITFAIVTPLLILVASVFYRVFEQYSATICKKLGKSLPTF